MAKLGRRAVLGLMAGGAVAAANSRVRSEPVGEGTDPRIRHIVVLMLENRSFDHMLGFLYADSGNVTPTGHAFDGLKGTESNSDGKGGTVKAAHNGK